VIAYSPDAEPARAFLLRNYNDIDVYVEDCACQNMYVTLVNRILHRKGRRITHVYPLGGKTAVINRCGADQAPSTRHRIYLIDGDLDLILGRPAPRLKHLYRLTVYCTENLLMSENAVVTIGTESSTNLGWHDMALRLSFKSMIEHSIKKLAPLFITYAITHKIGLNIDTTSYPIQRFLKIQHEPSSLSGCLIRSRMNVLIREIQRHVTAKNYRHIRNVINEKARRFPDRFGSFISGKTYLLPLVQLQLRKVAGFNESSDKLKARLAQHCEIDIDSGLPRALWRALKTL
jgi:hypothetical protein